MSYLKNVLCLLDSDQVAASLFKLTEKDHILQELFQLLSKAFALTIQRLLIDHLPGGTFQCHHYTGDNASPERDFAILERLMSREHNDSYIALVCYYVLLLHHRVGVSSTSLLSTVYCFNLTSQISTWYFKLQITNCRLSLHSLPQTCINRHMRQQGQK